jgi:TIR domain-containing protein
MPVSVFISHSSENKDFAELARNSLQAAGIEVLIDSIIEPGEPWEHTLRSLVNKADVLLILVSHYSLASEWVQFECLSFLARKKENPDLEVIPILIDDSELPGFLANYQVADFRMPDKYLEKLEAVARQISNRRLTPTAKLPPPKSVEGLRASAEQKRLEEMIFKAVTMGIADLSKQVRDILEVFQKQQYLLTTHAISLKEKMAVAEIWVVTTHLYNDTQDAEIRESVNSNLARGIHYKYFIDKEDPLIIRRIPEFEKLYAVYAENYKFIPLPAGLLMPFDELVLYDPLELSRIWGYAQINYTVPGKGEDNLFLRLSSTHSISIASSLRHLAYSRN